MSEPLFEWSEVIHELISFLASFAAVGAVGFRYGVLRGRFAPVVARAGAADREPDFFGDAAATAAVIGLVGAIVQVVLFYLGLQAQAARKHLALGAAFSAGGTMTMLQVLFLLLELVGFVVAMRRVRVGWLLAAIGVLALALRGVFAGQWARLINPIHALMGGLWIGTLFVMVAAGIGASFRRDVPPARRGQVVSEMVRAFSPLALGAAAILALFGVITAWRHLHVLSNLWTTPYGLTLIVKLCLVAGVAALGAWNWRRVGPSLGAPEGAVVIRRSATSELTVALLVLITTAILVSMPAPRRPGPPGERAPGAPGPTPPGAVAR